MDPGMRYVGKLGGLKSSFWGYYLLYSSENLDHACGSSIMEIKSLLSDPIF